MKKGVYYEVVKVEVQPMQYESERIEYKSQMVDDLYKEIIRRAA